jgi:hypothetical protein
MAGCLDQEHVFAKPHLLPSPLTWLELLHQGVVAYDQRHTGNQRSFVPVAVSLASNGEPKLTQPTNGDCGWQPMCPANAQLEATWNANGQQRLELESACIEDFKLTLTLDDLFDTRCGRRWLLLVGAGFYYQDCVVRCSRRSPLAAFLRVIAPVICVIMMTGHWQVDATTPPAEKAALIDIYSSTGGPHWLDNTNWDPSTDPCTNGWHRVSCMKTQIGYRNS